LAAVIKGVEMDKVLIIDDEYDIAVVFGRVAEAAGYNSLVTTNPEEFMQWVKVKSPTHILMDLQMPDMDGVELLRYLASIKCRAQIILISGFDSRVIDITAKLAKEQGLIIAATLNKPVSAKQLKALLAELKSELNTSPQALKSAIENKEFYIQLQPKLNFTNEKSLSFEALLRWRHPELGMIPPDEFIPEFEKHGLYKELTDYVLEQACDAISEMKQQGITIHHTAINISAGDLSDLNLANRLKAICRNKQIQPNNITLEITETVAMADPVTAMDNLARIRLAGFGLSLDDFGTGFSSLAFLRSMPFSEIKIDRLFIQDALKTESDQVIIKAIISLGKVFNMKVVAEGCEDEQTLSLLAKLGCDLVQGYHIARPMEVKQAIDYVRSKGI
jgi:EAL domain-containing protein (putative c-di-GMP-specific phosphodiesterase class I)